MSPGKLPDSELAGVQLDSSHERLGRTADHRAASWSTEDIAPRMSRITSLTCDTEVSRISSAVTAEIDWETEEEIGPVFAPDDPNDELPSTSAHLLHLHQVGVTNVKKRIRISVLVQHAQHALTTIIAFLHSWLPAKACFVAAQ